MEPPSIVYIYGISFVNVVTLHDIKGHMRNDYLNECMSEFRNIAIDQFNKAYCLVCANADCSRSRANNTLFQIRTANWEKDLFIDPPKLEPQDPIAVSIINKWYKASEEVGTAPPVKPSSFVATPPASEPEKTSSLPPEPTAAPKTTKADKKPKKAKEKPKNNESLDHSSVVVTESTAAAPPVPKVQVGQVVNPFMAPSSTSPASNPDDISLPLGGTFVLD